MRFVAERKDSLRFDIAFCLMLSILLTGCGSGNSNNGSTSSSAGLSGNWQMSLQPSNASWRPTSQSGSLVDTNGVLTGGVAFQDIACPGVGSVSGNVDGSTVTFTVTPAGVDIQFSGTVSQTNVMGGDYTILSTGCSGVVSAPQTGTWVANLVSPLNVNIQGAFTSTAKHSLGATFSITGKLSQGSNTGQSTTNLTGTLNATGYCAFTTADIAGTISGTSVVLSLVAADGSQLGQISGTASLDATSFNGTYKVVGIPPCAADAGAVSWASTS